MMEEITPKKSNIEIVATTIIGSEKAYGLTEINEQSPGSKGFHRYQVIQVNRDGHLANFRRDMGPVSNFKGVKQLRIPSLFEHTVDELMDMAVELRNETEIDIKDWLKLDKLKLVS